MTPPERVARRTWNWLAQGYALGARLGEETLTDLLMLDMLPYQRSQAFKLSASTKAEEAQCGADLLLAIRYPTGRWARFAIQAKKLYPNDVYRTLNAGARCLAQLTRLERFARLFHALPLYILYNHASPAHSAAAFWHCPLPFQPDQLGCTLLPSWRIRRAAHRPQRTFGRLNAVPEATPWRCIFHCPASEQLIHHLGAHAPAPSVRQNTDSTQSEPYDWFFGPIETGWPGWAFELQRGEMTPDALDQLRRGIATAIGFESGTDPEADLPPAETIHLPRVFLADLTVRDEPRG